MTLSSPVAALKSYGSTFGRRDWPSYCDELGLSAKHVSELVALLRDRTLWSAPEDSADAWAPAHAWRALAQLRAPEVIEPLQQMVRAESILAHVEFDRVAALVGPPAIAALAAAAVDGEDPLVQLAAINGLAAIAVAHPESRGPCVQALTRALALPRSNDLSVNASAVEALIRLRARESKEVIKAAFLAQQVELSEVTWDEVLEAFG